MSVPHAQVPRHVAIIMDGNGRWAESRGFSRIKGHEAGAESVRAAVRASRDAGVQFLTLYAFSTENWVRPLDEVRGLMELLRRFLKTDENELHDKKVRLRIIGHMNELPKRVQKDLVRVMEATREYTSGTLTLALSYGGRDEIVDATRAIARESALGKIDPETITVETIAAHLYAPDIPDPDLMIRTGGEMRISNFLLWQISYSELYVTDVLWPDFREEHFAEALEDYRRRHRRFGGVR